MNPRIKELIKSTGGISHDDDGNELTPMLVGSGLEKFAELIVKECCNWIDGSPSTDAGQLLLTKSFIIANLKGHFGVGS